MPRATTAAWLVMPPRVVRMPRAACMPWMSSGLVSMRTRMIASPFCARLSASSAVNTTAPRRGAGTGRQALRQQRARRLGIERGMQQLIERRRVHPPHRLGLVDQPLARHVHRDPQRRRGGAFAVARLQHVELALLDRELEVLHVAVVLLQRLADLHQFRVRPGHRRLQRRLARLGASASTAAAACGCRPPRPRPARSPGTRRRTRSAPVDGSRVKHTPVAQSLPMLPNTMVCTFTAVPHSSGMSCSRR